MNATLPLAGANASAPAASPALTPVLSSSSPQALPGIADAAFSWGGYFEALAWLCFALALLCLVLWLIKKRGGIPFAGGAPSAARIESRLALGPKKWLMTVHFQERRLLLGVTEQHITLLCELPLEDAAPSRTDAAKAFASAMEKETGGGRT